jgi:hypothetical protein
MNWIKRISFVLALIFIGFTTKSCGIYDFKGANIPNDIKTFSVGFFTNEASLVNPKLAMNLTEKLKTKFQTETRLGLDAENGDYQFAGTIVNYILEPAAISPTTGASQTQFTMGVRIEFNCQKYPEKNFTKTFTSSKIFDATTEFTSIEDNLTEELGTIITQQIFVAVALDW